MKLRTKIEEYKKSHELKSNKLVKEIAELESDFERNSEKMRRLCDVNENMFKKVWQLNVKRAMTLVKKVIKFVYDLVSEKMRI